MVGITKGICKYEISLKKLKMMNRKYISKYTLYSTYKVLLHILFSTKSYLYFHAHITGAYSGFQGCESEIFFRTPFSHPNEDEIKIKVPWLKAWKSAKLWSKIIGNESL